MPAGLAERMTGEENRDRLQALLRRIPHGTPQGWEREIFTVGGLMYLGFSAVQTEKLVVISSQGQSVIDCRTGEKTYCTESYDELDLIACAEPLGDEVVPLAGIGGGGLRQYSPAGDILTLAAPDWPIEQVIFMPHYTSWYQNPEKCTVLLNDYRILAYGFSRCGRYIAIGTSSETYIFRRVQNGG